MSCRSCGYDFKFKVYDGDIHEDEITFVCPECDALIRTHIDNVMDWIYWLDLVAYFSKNNFSDIQKLTEYYQSGYSPREAVQHYKENNNGKR